MHGPTWLTVYKNRDRCCGLQLFVGVLIENDSNFQSHLIKDGMYEMHFGNCISISHCIETGSANHPAYCIHFNTQIFDELANMFS